MPETQGTHTAVQAQAATAAGTAGPWEFEHQLHYFTQFETRPGQPGKDGNRWAEHQPTGKVNAVCNCGLATGWADRDQTPRYRDLLPLHPGHPEPA
ncbi:hypothetical protein [Streptomyces sp. H39-C1]|uniref:hypothetical protein n=1 Tax=Streptomyces sp. H39-C1 TaxID=3004355 RepID=UPI0022AF8A2E|nr:hypothetical protein [Streptomyces sp. H39-C1]MCZ4099853.1 hypothetical protein [Streptomyces sp. H39-C1]